MMEKLSRIKYYIISMLLAIAGYTWAMSNGTRLIGDDKESKEERSVNGARSFYHK